MSEVIEDAEGHVVRLRLLGEVSKVGIFVRTCSDKLSTRLAHVLSRWDGLWHSLLFPKAQTCIRLNALVPLSSAYIGLYEEGLRHSECQEALAFVSSRRASLVLRKKPAQPVSSPPRTGPAMVVRCFQHLANQRRLFQAETPCFLCLV